MPFFGFLFFSIAVIALTIYTISFVVKYLRTKDREYLSKLALVWFFPALLIGLAIYAHYPISKERIVGVYKIDSSFYPGANADWQKEHFYFEIKENNEFLFHEKLKDGTYKTEKGQVEWFRNSPPMLFRIAMPKAHPLIDQYPTLYRGKRKFYYVFESKFGNMFYRKVQ